jgi:transcriptional regulator with GAF, ATPase, and Fis domain
MLTEVDGCELLLLNEKKNQLEIISHIGFSQDWIGKRIVDYSDSLTQRAVKNNETLKIYDLNTEILYTRKNLARKNQLTSLLLIPITSGDTCLGTL